MNPKFGQWCEFETDVPVYNGPREGYKAFTLGTFADGWHDNVNNPPKDNSLGFKTDFATFWAMRAFATGGPISEVTKRYHGGGSPFFRK